MKTPIGLLAAALLTVPLLANAQTTTSAKALYSLDTKAAAQRYVDDKKLCNDETSSAARLQCRRDAKAEYDQAMAAAKARLNAATSANSPATAAPCPDCGQVIAVATVEQAGEGSALGLIAGGAAGALLGHQVGAGTGKDLATVAGALGGAYAGKKIEEKVKTHTVWRVTVQFQGGGREDFSFDQDPGFKVGEAVRKSGTTVTR